MFSFVFHIFVLPRCVIDISVQAVKEDHIWQDEETPSIRVVVPGPPNPPKLCCTAIRPEEFILEWGEPRLYGGAGIRGYQVMVKLSNSDVSID